MISHYERPTPKDALTTTPSTEHSSMPTKRPITVTDVAAQRVFVHIVRQPPLSRHGTATISLKFSDSRPPAEPSMQLRTHSESNPAGVDGRSHPAPAAAPPLPPAPPWCPWCPPGVLHGIEGLSQRRMHLPGPSWIVPQLTGAAKSRHPSRARGSRTGCARRSLQRVAIPGRAAT